MDFILPTREDMVDAFIPPQIDQPVRRARWAYVRSVIPLTVQMRGAWTPEDPPQPILTPANSLQTAGKLNIGDMVLTLLTDRNELIVVSRAGGPDLAGYLTFLNNYRASAVESTSVSWNDLGDGLHPRLMHGSNNPNGPGITTYFYVITYSYGPGDNKTQIAYQYASNVTYPEFGPRMAMRYCFSGVWSWWNPSPWQALPVTGFSGGSTSCRWRVTDSSVFFNFYGSGLGSIAAGGIASGGAVSSTPIPVPFRPTIPVPLAAVSGGSYPGTAYMNSNGLVGYRNTHTAAVTEVAINGSWSLVP